MLTSQTLRRILITLRLFETEKCESTKLKLISRAFEILQFLSPVDSRDGENAIGKLHKKHLEIRKIL